MPTTSFKNKRPDRFRPRFPIDPPSSSTAPRPGNSSTPSTLEEPWLLKPDRIPPSVTACKRDVVLVLGVPSGTSVEALLASRSLIHSLVIFASHRPPTLPPSPIPSVRVLRLVSPLAVEDTGAARLVSTLEWAERVARVWRASSPDSADVAFYDEGTKDTPIPRPGSSRSFDIPSSSLENKDSGTFRSRRGLPIIGKRRRSSSLSGHLSTGSLPPVDPSQRPFDTILNYISRDVPEKQILKQIILVASITRPFLAPTLSPYHKLSGTSRNLRRSLSGRGRSLPPTPPHQSGDFSAPTTPNIMSAPDPSATGLFSPRSHVIHVVPQTVPVGLIHSADLFLSSFSRQTVGPEDVPHAKQYVLNSSTMRERVVHPQFHQGKCTVLSLILLGFLDPISGKSWIGSGQKILFLPTSSPSTASPSPPVPPKPVRPPSRTTSDHHRSVKSISDPHTRMKPCPQPPPASHGEPQSRLRRSSKMVGERSQEVSERDRRALQNAQPHSDRTQRPYTQDPNRRPPQDASVGATTLQPRSDSIKRPNKSELPTPPDSNEDVRQRSPPSRSTSSKASTQSAKSKWRFWKT